MDGVLVIDKPGGLTSHDVVVRARRLLDTRRVGHVGTLDPMATGVLPLVVGRATRLASLLSVGPKVYEATIKLGLETDTFDITGSVVAASAEPAGHTIDLEAVTTACQAFTGTFQQVPPPYSAKKVRGVRAYRMARRQQAVTLEPVEVTVDRFELIELDGENRLRCRVSASAGFYMRSLAHDLGQRLGCGGCLASLRRERSGLFTLEQAVGLEELQAEDGPRPEGWLVSMSDLLPQLPGVVATERGALRAAHGNVLMPDDFAVSDDSPGQDVSTSAVGRVKVYDAAGSLLAIAEEGPGRVLHPRIVLV